MVFCGYYTLKYLFAAYGALVLSVYHFLATVVHLQSENSRTTVQLIGRAFMSVYYANLFFDLKHRDYEILNQEEEEIKKF